ncbi:hypothetical protein PIB30_071483 [Stylosanthes scabra]|uniref:Uncharacterized protein n=1 Tax=Stylosanthes scabra TaxID=79078 RepID=A0ABU6YMN3_9FABA|nr:hypothetical protein [Stylosanthes scabra]
MVFYMWTPTKLHDQLIMASDSFSGMLLVTIASSSSRSHLLRTRTSRPSSASSWLFGGSPLRGKSRTSPGIGFATALGSPLGPLLDLLYYLPLEREVRLD